MTADAPRATAHTDHPAPQRSQTSLLSLWVGLALGPLAWFLQLTIDTTLLGNVCDTGTVPRAGGLGAVLPIVLTVDAVTLVLTAVAAAVAWRNWHRTAGEQAGGGHDLLASGAGRTRFMAMAGLLTCGLIALAVLYIGAGHLLLGECGT